MQLQLVRWGLNSLVCVAALFIGYRVVVYIQGRPPQPTLNRLADNQADAWINGFTYQHTQSGSMNWEVVAERALVFENQHRAKLEVVQVHLFGENRETMVIEADEGILNTTTNDFDLNKKQQQVIIHLASGYRIIADHFKWTELTHKFTTKDAVKIQGNGVTITGKGLIGYLDSEKFKILHHVRADISL